MFTLLSFTVVIVCAIVFFDEQPFQHLYPTGVTLRVLLATAATNCHAAQQNSNDLKKHNKQPFSAILIDQPFSNIN